MKALILQVVLYAIAINSTQLDKETPLDSQYVDITQTLRVLRITDEDVKIYFRNKQFPDNDIPLSPYNYEKLENDGFSAEKDTVLLIHGWKNSYKSTFNKLLSEAYLSKHDINILVIDWSSVADTWYYPSAVGEVESVGEVVGNFIKRLQTRLQLNLDKTSIVGHSLGAHVAGVAGRTVGGKINYIVGLDPASLGFNFFKRNSKLRPTDAKFVQILHTSLYGIAENMGHADYYANGFVGQPGCSWWEFKLCSHNIAYKYFGESIKSGGFKAQSCRSNSELIWSGCKGPESYMGQFDIDKTASGMYYFETNSEPPYAKA
uniref:Phospholipase A1-like n=1 Tax=Diabrotica virgifera virgifera TaxID=50390 RepID=A0A6P7F8K9_DIAVI